MIIENQSDGFGTNDEVFSLIIEESARVSNLLAEVNVSEPVLHHIAQTKKIYYNAHAYVGGHKQDSFDRLGTQADGKELQWDIAINSEIGEPDIRAVITEYPFQEHPDNRYTVTVTDKKFNTQSPSARHAQYDELKLVVDTLSQVQAVYDTEKPTDIVVPPRTIGSKLLRLFTHKSE